MPPIAAGAIVGAIGLTGVTATIATTVLSVAFSAALSAAAGAIFGKEPSQPNFSSEQRERAQIIRSSVEPRRIIYGESVSSGPLVAAFLTGSRKQYLHLVIPVAHGESEEIGDVFLDNKLSSHDRFDGFVRVRKHLGHRNQAADEKLVEAVPQWTSDHRLRGITYLYLRLLWDEDQRVWPTGIPNIKCIVKGRKVYDPRDPGQTEGDPDTYKWSRNAQLCIRDWIRSPFGVNAGANEFSTEQVISDANLCDELVQVSETRTQLRYTCDGVVFSDESRYQLADQLLSCCAGALTWSQGKYRIYSGAYRIPLTSINDNDLREMPELRPHIERSQLFNVVRGTFIDKRRSWVSNDFVPVRNDFYIAQDGGEEIVREFEFSFTNDNKRAQRLAKIKLERTRAGTLKFPAKVSALPVSVFEPVAVSIDIFGFDNKVMLPTRIELHEGGAAGIDIEFQYERAEIYEWNSGEARELDFADDIDLDPAFEVAAPDVPEIFEELDDTRIGVRSKVVVETAGSADQYVRQYQFEYRKKLSPDWRILPLVNSRRAEIFDLEPGIYEFRVLAINSFGIKSAYANASSEVYGLTGNPSPVTGLTVLSIGSMAHLSWDLHSDLDVRKGGAIEFRHSSQQVGATVQNSVSLARSVSGSMTEVTLPLLPGTYFAIARDSSDSPSLTAAAMSTSAATVVAYASVDSLVEAPSFPGAKTNLIVDAGRLKLAGQGTIDSVPSFDAIASLDLLGGLHKEGTYFFSGAMIRGAIETLRLETEVGLIVQDETTTIDQRIGTIDTWPSFDGSAGVRAEVSIYVRLTDDDPSGSPTWSNWVRLTVGEFSFRAAEFKAEIKTESQDHNVLLQTLSVFAKQVV